MKYIFLLTIWNPVDRGAPIVDVVLDNLTGAQCIREMRLYAQRVPDFRFGIPSCEIDAAFKMEKGLGQ